MEAIKRTGRKMDVAWKQAISEGRKAGAKIKTTVKAISTRVLDGPAKPGLTKFVTGTAASNLRDGAILGGVGTAAGHGFSKVKTKIGKAAVNTGIRTATPSLAAQIGRGALAGGRASVGPVGLALTGAMIAGEAYSQKRARDRSIRGRARAVKSKIATISSATKSKVINLKN